MSVRKIVTGILCIFFAFAAAVSASAQSVYVPLNHPVYQFIERFEAKGVLKCALTGTKPFSRREAASFLTAVHDKSDAGFPLTSVERDQLLYYEQEFREEIGQMAPARTIPEAAYPGWFSRLQRKLPGAIYENGRNFYSRAGENYSIFIDPILNQDNAVADVDTLAACDEVYRYASGFRIRGSVNDRAGFFVDIRNTKEWGSRAYPQVSGLTAPGLGYVKNFGSYQFHDETIAYLVFRLSPLELELGKNLNRWGPGRRGGLLLSDNATSYDLVKLKFGTRRLKFVHFFGILTAYPRIIESVTGENASEKIKYANKYIAAHRLEINLSGGVNVGLSEAVIYGQRQVELAYLNPLMFLRSAEHYLGDQDNALMGADVTLRLVSGWTWYGELLIDDLYTRRLGTKWYGNKLGFLAGAFWTDPFSLPNSSVRLEYTRIKPFVYTHKYPVNVYKHFDTGLGHPLGPNADEWYFEGAYHYSRRVSFALEALYSRHGANTPDFNAGGDINEPHDPASPTEIGFLEGDVQRQRSLKLSVSYEPFRNLFLTGYLNVHSGKNFRIREIPGSGFTSRDLFLAVRLNY